LQCFPRYKPKPCQTHQSGGYYLRKDGLPAGLREDFPIWLHGCDGRTNGRQTRGEDAPTTECYPQDSKRMRMLQSEMRFGQGTRHRPAAASESSLSTVNLRRGSLKASEVRSSFVRSNRCSMLSAYLCSTAIRLNPSGFGAHSPFIDAGVAPRGNRLAERLGRPCSGRPARWTSMASCRNVLPRPRFGPSRDWIGVKKPYSPPPAAPGAVTTATFPHGWRGLTAHHSGRAGPVARPFFLLL
jgi:hypothetical protein